MSKLHYLSSAAVPMQKSCKGNIVQAQMNNRSSRAMPKVLERQHRDVQVDHKCVSPPPISPGGERLSALLSSSRPSAYLATSIGDSLHIYQQRFLFTFSRTSVFAPKLLSRVVKTLGFRFTMKAIFRALLPRFPSYMSSSRPSAPSPP